MARLSRLATWIFQNIRLIETSRDGERLTGFCVPCVAGGGGSYGGGSSGGYGGGSSGGLYPLDLYLQTFSVTLMEPSNIQAGMAVDLPEEVRLVQMVSIEPRTSFRVKPAFGLLIGFCVLCFRRLWGWKFRRR